MTLCVTHCEVLLEWSAGVDQLEREVTCKRLSQHAWPLNALKHAESEKSAKLRRTPFCSQNPKQGRMHFLRALTPKLLLCHVVWGFR